MRTHGAVISGLILAVTLNACAAKQKRGADEILGVVSGTKRSGYTLRMTVSIRPRGSTQMIVRSSAQYNLQTVEDPEPYQQFFTALSKALFLEAQQVK